MRGHSRARDVAGAFAPIHERLRAVVFDHEHRRDLRPRPGPGRRAGRRYPDRRHRVPAAPRVVRSAGRAAPGPSPGRRAASGHAARRRGAPTPGWRHAAAGWRAAPARRWPRPAAGRLVPAGRCRAPAPGEAVLQPRHRHPAVDRDVQHLGCDLALPHERGPEEVQRRGPRRTRGRRGLPAPVARADVHDPQRDREDVPARRPSEPGLDAVGPVVPAADHRPLRLVPEGAGRAERLLDRQGGAAGVRPVGTGHHRAAGRPPDEPWFPRTPPEVPLPPQPPGPDRPGPPVPPVPIVPGPGGPLAGGEELRSLVYERLLERRTVMLDRPLDAEAASLVAAQLVSLDGEGDGPITLVVNSPGGPLDAVPAVLDALDLVRGPVDTTCLG